MKRYFVLAIVAITTFVVAKETPLFPILKSTVTLGKQPEGFYLLPTNQLLRPWGDQLQIPGRPVDLAFDSKKRLLAILNTHSVEIVDGTSGAHLASADVGSTSYTGLAWSRGDHEIWASQATRNGPDTIAVVQLDDAGKPGKAERIALKGHPVPAGIAFSADGSKVYIAFSRNNTLAVFDAATRKLEREIEVGMVPFNVVFSAKNNEIYVSNRGGRAPKTTDTVAPSSGTMIVTDPQTGATTTGTLTILNAKTLEAQQVDVGLAPASLALDPNESLLAVADGHSDSVTVVNLKSHARTQTRIPTWPGKGIGSQPIAVTFAPDGQRLYVACAGNNAVAILTPSGKQWKVAGAIPTGYFPSALEIDSAGALRVLNLKGFANTLGKDGSHNSRNFIGTLSQIPAVTDAQLAAGTREVIAANTPQLEPAGGVDHPEKLGIEHVLFIIKENRTYDQVLGDLPKGNGDPKYVQFGRDITPNHHALAERYVTLDNFYTGGAISFDGHQWLMQAFVSDYTERAFASSPRGYAWNMADALTVSPAGFFWQGAPRPIDLRIYGEFCLPALWDATRKNVVDINEGNLKKWSEYWKLYKEGNWHEAVGSRSGVPALQKYISPRYPVNATFLPDQIRASEFLEELAEYEKADHLPQLTVLTLTADHTNGTNPSSPTPRAMVADDDLALGRIVEGVSKSKFWDKTLILVVEDDAQNGLDHVDGHRTVALAIGPYIRRAAVDSNNYNHESMVRTIQALFNIPPHTRFLQSARVMTSIFTNDADLKPYAALTPKVALDEMNPPFSALSGRRLWAARESAKMDWADPDDAPADTLNKILWWESKGYDTPYPVLHAFTDRKK